ncbi:hypothetical protein [Clostridium butyricum]|uniref:Phage protein, HK97 gp10 family n=1 Tax=Clostridium butyricum E4 str. BoNT E BL5262 TaxID=632245 RepID=C4IGZ7_CLOBU|nr:hypothetical protein [Clostridium butyricum]EEP54859.1 phage protein, HK97 gp10 family [Clostridium butyricum E4 str. BoNT E BL5262]NFL30560.1 hypothetical protein [Clostridium butyricum]NFS19515.1 hypothetical protein [Clostridium butyricum]
MSIEIKGINNLLKRLDKLSKLESEKAVEMVAKDMEQAIKQAANVFSNNSDLIKTFEPRKYGGSTYIDVGLKGDKENFKEWCHLWYQQFGFYNHGWNFKNNHPYIDAHKMWFDNALESNKPECMKRLKEELKKQVNECWNG